MAETDKNGDILEVKGLKMHFPVRGGVLYRQMGSVKAVDGVDLTIGQGETLGFGRRIRLRKIHLGQMHRATVEPHRRSGDLQGN